MVNNNAIIIRIVEQIMCKCIIYIGYFTIIKVLSLLNFLNRIMHNILNVLGYSISFLPRKKRTSEYVALSHLIEDPKEMTYISF